MSATWLGVELLIVGLVFAAALKAPRRGTLRGLSKLARRRQPVIIGVGLLSLAINALLSFGVQWPIPATHDEFVYLLGADTFASGRWTNPTHPHWEHFETFHVIHVPSYQSKYPPAQSCFLAVGQVVLDQPIVGVWLSHALACAATCWMLYAWVPPRWAMAGGVLATLHPVTLAYWGQSYWGGAAAMLGGALVFGAFRRILKRPTVGSAVCLALGLAIVANSRPYEGLVACLPAFAVLTVWLLRRPGPPLRDRWIKVVLPVLVVGIVVAAVMAVYHHQVTGSAWRMPYQVWSDTYSKKGVHLFFWQTQTPSRVEVLPKGNKPTPASASERVRAIGTKAAQHWNMFFCVMLSVPLLAVWRVRRNAWVRFAALTVLLTYIALLLQSTTGHLHYVAPITCLLWYFVVLGLRVIGTLRRGEARLGRGFLPVFLFGYAAMATIYLITQWEPVSTYHEWSKERARILGEWSETGERHLVFVRYLPPHNADREWVYNAADLDNAPVLWVRELGPARDAELVAHYKDRRVWLLITDDERFVMQPHPLRKP